MGDDLKTAREEWEAANMGRDLGHGSAREAAKKADAYIRLLEAERDEARAEVERLKQDPPVVPVKWTPDGWTNTETVVLKAETQGYIDWPTTLIIAALPAPDPEASDG